MKNIITTIFIFLSYNIFSQNLIPNPGFEDVNVCQTYHEHCSPKAWRNILLKGFRFPETAFTGREGIHSKEGQRSVILPLYHKARKKDRIYIQVPFLCELEKGKEYEFSFYYLLTEQTTQEFHIFFPDTLYVHHDLDYFLGKKSDYIVPLSTDGEFRVWKEFKMNYIANGNEQGFVIGNSTLDKDIEITTLKKLKKKDYYPKRLMIWLDQFSFSTKEGIKENCKMEEMRERIYLDSVRHFIAKIETVKDLKENIVIEEEETIITEENKEEIVIPVIEGKEEKIIPKTKPILIENKIVLNQKFVLRGIHFKTNSAELEISSFEDLKRLLEYLKNNPDLNLLIEGHTDNVGSDAYNMKLSRNRANTVANYFIENGISIQRLRTLGRGELLALFDNETEEGREKNRRVEFIFE